MELKNGYKLVYAKKDASGKIDLFASKTGIPSADDTELDIDSYIEDGDIKLVYAVYNGKNCTIKYSTTGIPTEDDDEIAELDELYIDADDDVQDQIDVDPAEQELTNEAGGAQAAESAENN